MSMFSGLRRLGDIGNYGVGFEFSANGGSNNGVFSFFAPDFTAKYEFSSKGTTNVAAGTTTGTFPAPSTVIATGLANISTPSLQLRVNGSVIATTTTTQGTGNYGNYALYFGARGGTSLYFNGYECQTIIVGKTLTATEVTNTETYVNSKTKAYA